MPLLDWLNKDQAVRTARQVPYRLLEHDASLSVGEPDTGNMLIQGDNLEALKALLPLYAGKVKCIYIDPPYNTRSAFEHYDDNLEHSVWLSMMYPRLELLRELLAEDGSIWVSIDDNEGHYLKVIMDEVFGRSNLISNIVWQKIYTVKNTAKHFSDMHDHILLYSKNYKKWKRNDLPRTDKQDNAYKNPDKDARGGWKATPIQARNFYSKGQYSLTTPSGRFIEGPPKGTYWRMSEEKFYALNADNRIWWGKKGSNTPAQKRFLSEVKSGIVPSTMWFHEDAGHNAEAKNEIKIVLSEEDNIFITPKPERLIQRILYVASNKDDLILDSFLGSGTTAAVAHKMGRRYIGIEMGEHAVTHCQPRLEKVVDGEQGGISKAVDWQGGGGFRFYRLGETAFDAAGHIHTDIGFASLAAHVWFLETHTPLDGAVAGKADSPLLGVHGGVAYYLLYNGILGDRRPRGGNVLTGPVLAGLPSHDGPRIIYGEATRFGEQRLTAEGITFKQIPYDVRTR